jgi:hypothetical protein
VSQVDDELVAFFQLTDDVWGPFVPSRLVKHWMDNQDALRDRLTLVAGEPIWKDRVRSVLAKLWEDSDWHSCVLDVLDESTVLQLDQGVEFFAVLIVFVLHELVVGECLFVRAEVGGLDGVDSFGESGGVCDHFGERGLGKRNFGWNFGK